MNNTPITEVYVMYSELRGITKTMNVKIGISNNVQDRVKGVQTGNPGKVHLIKSFKAGKEALKHEKYFHNLYSKNHISGEWYEFNNDTFTEIVLPDMYEYFSKIEVIEEESGVILGKDYTTLSLQEITENIDISLQGNDYVSQKLAIIHLEKAILAVEDEHKKTSYKAVIDKIQNEIIKQRDAQRKINLEKLAIKQLKLKQKKAQKELELISMGYLIALTK